MKKGFNEELFIRIISVVVLALVITLYVLGFIYMVGE